ncbi:MAG: DUF4832 domain-containing protein [Eubacteriales bacterium]|nr:DUF4832 domain-containing protein [Eubacteriales bacterium]
MLFNRLYQKAQLKESFENICNPARGFYQIFTVVIGEDIDYQLFTECLVEKESLVLLLIDIGKYHNEELSEEATAAIKTAICFFAEHEKDIILRVVYDHEGNALKWEPDDFSLVKKHLQTIGRLIQPWRNQIFIFQGLLIGNWGEMHGSKFQGIGQLRELVEILDRELGKDVFLAVRKPVIYRMLRNEYLWKNNRNQCKIGLFNDAIMSSETDMGTYGVEIQQNWDKMWTRQEELEFQNKLCAIVPNGGEAVYGDGFVDGLTIEEMMLCFRKMHISYLNRLYDCNMLNLWKEKKYDGRDVWRGKNVYEYVQAHLGYRFVIQDFRMSRKEDGYVQASVWIKNTGFANAYHEMRVEVVAQCGQDERMITVCGDLSGIASGMQMEMQFVCSVHPKKKNVTHFYLQAFRVLDGKRIHFGNEEQRDRVYIGKLMNYEIDEVIS